MIQANNAQIHVDALAPPELKRFRQKFTCALVNLTHVKIYWSPAHREIYARRQSSCRREFALPSDAILVGEYSEPFRGRDFIEDLQDLLSDIEKARHG